MLASLPAALAAAAPGCRRARSRATIGCVTRARASRPRAAWRALRTRGLREGDLVARAAAELRRLRRDVPRGARARAGLRARSIATRTKTEVGDDPRRTSLGCLSRDDTPSTARDHRRPPCPEARLIKLTSGSTGMPKGDRLPRENLVADCSTSARRWTSVADDVNFGAIPFSHSYGFSNLVMPLLAAGDRRSSISNDYLPQSLIALAIATAARSRR